MQRASLAALALAGGAAVHGTTVIAQSAEEGLSASTLTATISQSVTTDSNYDLDDVSPGQTTYADTRFGLQLDQIGSDRVLSLGFDTGLRAFWPAKDAVPNDFEFQFASPSTAHLEYEQEGAHTAFDSSFRFRTRRVDFNNPLTDFITDEGTLPDDLEQLQGETSELRYDADIGFTLRPNAPSSYGVRLVATNIDYRNSTPDENLVPRYSVEGSGFWTLRLNPVLSTGLDGSYFYYRADDTEQTEVRIGEVDWGLIYHPSEALRVRGGLGYADRTREEVIDDVRETTQSNSGPVVRGDFRYDLPTVTVLGDARWTTAAPDPRLSFNLQANYNMPRSRLTGRAFNRYTGGQSGNEQQVSGIGFGVQHDLNESSRVGLDLSYAYQQNLDEPQDPDIERTNVTASFGYDLTRVVTSEIGYTFSNRTEGSSDADSHQFYFNIARIFQTNL